MKKGQIDGSTGFRKSGRKVIHKRKPKKPELEMFNKKINDGWSRLMDRTKGWVDNE